MSSSYRWVFLYVNLRLAVCVHFWFSLDYFVLVLFAFVVMAALCNRGAIIFLPCNFYLLLLSFFPRLISAGAGWMSTIL